MKKDLLVLPLEECEFREEEYYLTPNSIECHAVRAHLNDCEIVTVHIRDLDICTIRRAGGLPESHIVIINNLGYALYESTRIVTCVLYNDKLYHTVMHIPNLAGVVYLR